ncbi:SMI1/KNR4 family protein [Winogradskyella ouciana]|uniref:Uncharacterized protein n=1 Tax=Winogradskyella ouciana TaxID=2608631 RepID=A0A7K1G9N5_9FLAO|nr:SMI1/KNR4 family protein [Winogradskyella ouciana]MTE25755.1 hypothetical protein [Winogradskyella ouciana]
MKHIILIMGILSFFGANSQNSDNENYEKLTSELKDKYRKELKRDSEKEFKTEFVRVTNLESKIINQYGFDGIKLVFESKNSSNFHKLGEFPKDCPWTNLNDNDIKEFITQNFKPISEKTPNLISSLKERCKFIYAEKKENTWLLHYFLNMKLYDKRDYFRVYTGGSPLMNAKPNQNLKNFSWNIPNDLKLFYSIHNGFGEFYDGISILGNDEIKVMAEQMNSISKEENIRSIGYTFEQLLEFFPDGGGNAQCFFKNNSNSTVDWDHETWEISGKTEFFDFIDERLSVIDEE